MNDSTRGRRRGRDSFVLLALLALPGWCLGAGPGLAAEQGQPDPQSPQREAGGELFRQRCARCHGADGTGQPKRARGAEIPNFTDRTWQTSRTDDQLVASVLDGRGKGMPAFRDRLSEDQARELVARVRAFAEAQAAPATAEHLSAGRDERRPTGARTGFFGKLADWLAKFHPPAVSFPVALLVAAAVAELLLVLTGRPLFDAAGRFCVWLGALAALPAAALGWCCGGFRLEDSDWVLATHRWLGTSTALGALALLALSEAARRPGGRARPWFRAAVFAAAGLVLATGFFGGAVANGLAHYAWPR
jgi:mono/diheme cytochrome c family protein/uncharacterized membrane protein